jgi:HD superfamily phosphodiesterase
VSIRMNRHPIVEVEERASHDWAHIIRVWCVSRMR